MNTSNRVERIKGCCDSFTKHINRKCDEHGFDCPDNVIRLYVGPKSGTEFGIQHPDGISYYKISFCPWCGANITELAKASVKKA
jgi:hypothetical protein